MIKKIIRNTSLIITVIIFTVGLTMISRDIDRKTNGYIVKTEKVWLPIIGYKNTYNNLNDKIKLYIKTPDGVIDRSVFVNLDILKDCHPGDMIGKKIQVIEYTYNYSVVKYDLVDDNYSSYCSGYNLRDE